MAEMLTSHMETVSQAVARLEELKAMAGRLKDGPQRYEVDGVSIGERLVRNEALTAELSEHAQEQLELVARIIERLATKGEQP